MAIEYLAIESNIENWAFMQELAGFTADAQMVPLSQEKMLRNTLATVALDSGVVVGYCAQTQYYPDSRTAEVGSLIVDPFYRGQGIGTELIGITTARVLLSSMVTGLQIDTVLAFCNPNSAPLFKKRGYKHVSLTEIPPESLFGCSDCPKTCLFPLGSCCDVAYVYVDDAQDKVE